MDSKRRSKVYDDEDLEENNTKEKEDEPKPS